MNHSPVITVTTLPGIADLPPRAKFHFARALIAERQGNWLIAAFELNQAVVAEDQATDQADGTT
jgi:hypothetical protein